MGSPTRRTRYTSLVSIHAVLMSAWLILLCVQARLAHGGDLVLHRRLGRASGWLVAALVPLSAVVAVDFHREFGRTGTLVADFSLLIIFVPLYLAAIWSAKRGRIDVHKRLLLIGTIAMVSPALGRFTDIVGLPRPAAVPMYLLMLIGAPLTYDFMSRGRPHRASLAAIGVALAGFAVVIAVAIASGEL
jgi:uncharacterized membrane protein YozB (DUF420 family)